MTIFVWTNVLCDYTCGMAVIEAEDIHGAFEGVREARDEDRIPGYVADELLTTDPEPLSDGDVAWVYGGG